jgi:hypothetical protein
VIVHFYADSAVTAVERARRSYYLARIAIGKHFLVQVAPLLVRRLLELAKTEELLACVSILDLLRIRLVSVAVAHVMCLIVVNFCRANPGDNTWLCICAQQEHSNSVSKGQ